METITIIKELSKGSQNLQIVQDDEGDTYIQIMDEYKIFTPVWEGDVHQAEELINILQQAIKQI